MIGKCVAIISGGPDSTGYAAIWKARGYEVYPISFNYGQKGKKEVRVVKGLSRILGFNNPVSVNISSLKALWKNTQLTDSSVQVREAYSTDVVVPLRNGVFLVIASAYADTIGAELVIYGAHLNDASLNKETSQPLYPDCTPEFAEAMEEAINRGRLRTGFSRIKIQSPAREGMRKSELLKKSYELIGDAIFSTWSCYLSGRVHCGRCESCVNRKKAFAEAGIQDRTKYES